GPEYTAHRAAGAEQQDPSIRHLPSQRFTKIPHQADAVRVVAEQAAIIFQFECVDRSRLAGALGAAIRQPKSELLQRQGNVEAAATQLEEFPAGGFEFFRLYFLPGVDQILPGLLREAAVDVR